MHKGVQLGLIADERTCAPVNVWHSKDLSLLNAASELIKKLNDAMHAQFQDSNDHKSRMSENEQA
jgi:hypothetical protein